MRYVHVLAFAAGTILFLLALLDLYGMGVPGTESLVLWRAGVAVLLLDLSLSQAGRGKGGG
jgi:hypothetical protein